MDDLREALADVIARHGFSGVVRVDRPGALDLTLARGLADRAYDVPVVADTRFGTASATKSLTALTVVSLLAEGRLTLETTARSLLGADLPEIDDRVTVGHLLTHRSGIGDYLDEDTGFAASDYVMPVPVHRLAETEDYLAVLGGHPAKFAPGEAFSYCNGGFVVLALLVERVTGAAFRDEVAVRVCRPARMQDTAFLRSDELPGTAARGYLAPDGLRTNVLHLPVRGSGDGGAYTTVGDVHRLWAALFDGRILPADWVEETVRAHSDVPADDRRYGLGFWLPARPGTVQMGGSDAGVSFRSVHDSRSGVTATVVSNTSDGAWPVHGLLMERLFRPPG